MHMCHTITTPIHITHSVTDLFRIIIGVVVCGWNSEVMERMVDRRAAVTQGQGTRQDKEEKSASVVWNNHSH